MRKTIVIDSSVIVKWLSQDKEADLDAANRVLNDVLDRKIELLAPELAKYEIGNTLLYSKKLSLKQGTEVLNSFYTLPINFIEENEALAHEAYGLASKLGITYYDASFISLAKLYGATLVTANIKHQGKSRDIKVVSLEDY